MTARQSGLYHAPQLHAYVVFVDDDFSSLQGRAKPTSGAAPLLRRPYFVFIDLQGVDGHRDSGGHGPQPKVVSKKIFFTLLRDVKIWIKGQRQLPGRRE